MEKQATGKVSAPVDLTATHAQPRQKAQVIHLPLWPEAVRGVPNSVLRSALFGAIKRGRRTYLERKPLASVDGDFRAFLKPRRVIRSANGAKTLYKLKGDVFIP